MQIRHLEEIGNFFKIVNFVRENWYFCWFYSAPPSTSYYSSFYSPEPQQNSSWYLVRRTASAGEMASEIVPISNRSYTSSSSTLTSSPRAKMTEEPTQFYTDKHFSSKFLSDSVPLSQMIRYKK